MKWWSARLIALIGSLATVAFLLPAVAYPSLTADDGVYDFGCVDFDYEVYHDFHLVNRGRDTVNIKDVVVDCDCTTVDATDSSLAPGDTTLVQIRWSTSGFYGYVSKTIVIKTDNTDQPDFRLYYQGTIGKWTNKLVPEPTSVFMLPPAASKTVKIKNQTLKHVSVTKVTPEAAFFTVVATRPEANRGEALEIEVRPNEGLAKGSYQSSFRMTLNTQGSDKPLFISIPVKVVRY